MAHNPAQHVITNYRVSVGELGEWSQYMEAGLRCVIKSFLRTELGRLFDGYKPRNYSKEDLRELSESYAGCGDVEGELHRPLVKNLLDHLSNYVKEELTYDSSQENAVQYCCWPVQGGPWQAGAIYPMRLAKTGRPWLIQVPDSVPMFLKIDWDCPQHVAGHALDSQRELLEIKTVWPKLSADKRKQLRDLALA